MTRLTSHEQIADHAAMQRGPLPMVAACPAMSKFTSSSRIAAELHQLAVEADAAGLGTTAYLIRMALDEAERRALDRRFEAGPERLSVWPIAVAPSAAAAV